MIKDMAKKLDAEFEQAEIEFDEKTGVIVILKDDEGNVNATAEEAKEIIVAAEEIEAIEGQEPADDTEVEETDVEEVEEDKNPKLANV